MKMQRVQNAAARLVTGLLPRDHVGPALQEIHWLSIFFPRHVLSYTAAVPGPYEPISNSLTNVRRISTKPWHQLAADHHSADSAPLMAQTNSYRGQGHSSARERS